MERQHYLLNDVARRLGVKYYRIAYALAAGLVEEPETRIAGKRIFYGKDVRRLAAYFGVELTETGGDSHREVAADVQ
jgi:hypothetical protein